MSVTRSPIHNAARRAEELADAKRTTIIIGGLCALAAFAFVGSVLLMSMR